MQHRPFAPGLIRQQRIARAKQLIQTTDLSLTQISLECGFCDQAHFCHIFTRSEGINPFAWRCRTVRALSLTAKDRSLGQLLQKFTQP